MNKRLITLFIILLLSNALYADGLWQRMNAKEVPTNGTQVLHPSHYSIYSLDTAYMHSELFNLSDKVANGRNIALPMPDGTMRVFHVWRNDLLPAPLAARYPGIRSFTAYAIDNPRVTAKIDYTLKGFHAMIFNGEQTSFIDPYSSQPDGYYLCYYRRDYDRPLNERMVCDNGSKQNYVQPQTQGTHTLGSTERLAYGTQLQTYRLALACTGEYAQAIADTATPTKALALSAMTTTMNRVNGVYERELAITMQFVPNEDTLIFLVDTAGCYANNSGGLMMGQNQDTIDRRIGEANYDIGHVFSTGGGGIANIGCVCRPNMKAQGVTGEASPVGDAFDIDYVAHEMGHQYGADHTFNDNAHGACAGNANYLQSYEPGSGSTIMAYAGICDNDNLQEHSDDYFHAISINKIVTYTNSSWVGTCPTLTTTGNKPPGIAHFSSSYYIPYLTPFELTAPKATDSAANDEDTYCWEEWDRGDFGQTFENTHKYGPIFRSLPADTSRTRVFPRLDSLLQNITHYLGEKLPDSARQLHFKVTVRAIQNGIGANLFTDDDSVTLGVINTGRPFMVTSFNDSGSKWISGTKEVITWDVANTNTAPISCSNVDIYLSTDGGYTYPYMLADSIPNSGQDTVAVPNIHTPHARIKVKAHNNVFFDINNSDIAIEEAESVTVYPTLAKDVVNVKFGNYDAYDYAVYNDLGQRLVSGQHPENSSLLLTIGVTGYSKGMYIVVLINNVTGTKTVQKFVVQ